MCVVSNALNIIEIARIKHMRRVHQTEECRVLEFDIV